ncbi:hypothetical protein SAMN05216548_11325 [Faunimonas pinastri]|uniref:Uncharacterized protein n=1 Tax=Faunimonas pinastri TaxID=1855383 RepID=A0A1H9M9T0_9HYPH|nr:DUF5330 domain-containing protein [Faunimonas pinastri]SER20438.1 hypothetical protein SAMN05216548_11325 [Faunimonas pinastri]
MFFIARSLFWLGLIVMILPASPDGAIPAPRVSLLRSAFAARDLLADVTDVCSREPQACATSRETLVLFGRKLGTAASIVSAGLSTASDTVAGHDEETATADAVAANAAGTGAQSQGEPALLGTLTPSDLAPRWTASAHRS